MKKLLLYLSLYLIWCNWSYAQCISGDCVNGQGTFTYPDAGKYVGEFKNGKEEGLGTFTFLDGEKYEGQFKNSKPEGLGTYTFLNGGKYEGQFKDGKFEGQGTLYFSYVERAEKQKVVGTFRNNQVVEGTLIYTDGRKYEGQFKDGKFEGQGTFTFADGSGWSGQYKGGILIKEEESFKKGKKVTLKKSFGEEKTSSKSILKKILK